MTAQQQIVREKTILTYGTFDMFHVGHLNLLRALKSLGTRLIVGVSTDAFNTLKGKDTLIPFDQRVALVAGIRYVDEVFEEQNWEQKREDILRFKADIFAIGDDWAGKFDHLSDVCQIVYVPRTEGISTTEIKTFSRTIIREELANVLEGSNRISRIINTLLGKID